MFDQLFHLISLPLLKHLPNESGLIATQITATLLTPFKLALVTAIVITLPFTFYQLWGFVAPALYKREKLLIWPLVVARFFLFLAGMGFASFIVMPLMFKFFIAIAPASVEVRPDIMHYLNLVLRLFLAFGVAFQVPIVTMVLIRSQMISADSIAKQRPYIIIGAFILGMLLTPPDVFSQTLLAVPMWLLYEASIIIAAMTGKRSNNDSTPSSE